MSTPGSVRSGDRASYTPPAPKSQGNGEPRPRRTRIFRWEGIIPLVLGLALACIGWTLFGERSIRSTITEAGSKALGAELDIADLKIRALATTVELKGI